MRMYPKYMHTSTHVSTCIHAWKKMHRCVHRNEYVDKSTDKNTCVDKCTQRNACTKINARMHTATRMHTYAHTAFCLQNPREIVESYFGTEDRVSSRMVPSNGCGFAFGDTGAGPALH